MTKLAAKPMTDPVETAATWITSRAIAPTRRNDPNIPAGKAGDIIIEMENRLISGYYAFGEALSINALALEFGASRQPVSTVVGHLRALGYLTIVPQVGCRVASPSPTEIDDFFFMLAKIESAMASLAARRHTQEEADVLTAIADQIDATPVDTEAQRLRYVAGVDAYHEAIRKMARSPELIPRVANLWRLSDFYLWQGISNFTTPKRAIAVQERHAIADAIGRGDAELAAQLMEIHVRGKPGRVGII
jgi:DNA-binding GntR family transcriptional regulator